MRLALLNLICSQENYIQPYQSFKNIYPFLARVVLIKTSRIDNGFGAHQLGHLKCVNTFSYGKFHPLKGDFTIITK